MTMHCRILALSLALFLSSCVTGAGSGGPMVGQAGREPTDEELVSDFLTVALREGGNEDDRSNRGYVTRFHGPVRIRLHGDPGELERQRIEWVVGRMRSVTGHDIAFAAPNEPANYHVHMPGTSSAEAIAGQVFDNIPSLQGTLEKEARLEAKVTFLTAHLARQGGWICTGHLHLGKGRPDLESVHAVVSRGLDARRRNICIVEEMLQVLGLPGDTRKAWPSRFSDNTWLQDPSDYDWLYLRLLYDREIRAGMSPSQVRPIALQRVREWRAGGKRLAANPDPLPFDPATYAPSNELLLERFMASMFRKNSKGNGEILKWSADVSMLVTGTSDPFVLQKFMQKNADILTLTGRKISLVTIPGRHSIHIHIEKNWTRDAVAQAFSKFSSKHFLQPEVIREEESSLRQDRYFRPYLSKISRGRRNRDTDGHYYEFSAKNVSAEWLENCPWEGIMSAMGGSLVPHQPWPSENIFYTGCPGEFSPYDKLFLRILYDERLLPGMSYIASIPLIRQILLELRSDESMLPDASQLSHPAWHARQIRPN